MKDNYIEPNTTKILFFQSYLITLQIKDTWYRNKKNLYLCILIKSRYVHLDLKSVSIISTACYCSIGNTLTAQQQDFINSSYYDLMKRSNFNDMQKHQQQQGLTEVHSYNPYQSSLADPNQLSWKIEPSIIESFKNHHQQQQHQAAGKFQKKITKSSTTLFNQESHSSSQAQKQGQYFPHSTSYDNMACLNKLKPLKPLVNEFMSASASNDFLLESSFNNTSGNSGANRSAYYSSLNMSNKSKAG